MGSFFIDDKEFTLKEEYYGILYPLLKELEGINTKNRPLVEETILGCKEWLWLRSDGLKMVPYTSHPFTEIKITSIEAQEEDDSNKPAGGNPDIIAENHYNTRLNNQSYKDLSEKLTIPLDHLDWLEDFNTALSDFSYTSFEFRPVRRNLNALYKELRKTSNEIERCHIIPELIDWNLYISIRGILPTELRYTNMSAIIHRAYLDIRNKDLLNQAQIFLNSHPELITPIVKQGFTTHKDAPVGIHMQEAIFKEAKTRYNKILLEAFKQASQAQKSI